MPLLRDPPSGMPSLFPETPPGEGSPPQTPTTPPLRGKTLPNLLPHLRLAQALDSAPMGPWRGRGTSRAGGAWLGSRAHGLPHGAVKDISQA